MIVNHFYSDGVCRGRVDGTYLPVMNHEDNIDDIVGWRSACHHTTLPSAYSKCL